MPVKNEAFLALEFSLRDRLEGVVRQPTAILMSRIEKLVQREEFNAARDLIDEFDIESEIEKQANFMRVIAIQSMIFGTRDFVEPSNTVFHGKPIPEQIDKSVAAAIKILSRNMEESTKRVAYKFVNGAEKEFLETDELEEALEEDLSETVENDNKLFIGAAAALMVSKVASWGFMQQAGGGNFRVNEILDSKTCPVCLHMHGKIFPVGPAAERLERQLTIDDPDELKSMAPWPNQSKAGIKNLKAMSESELVNAGFDTPPYHPFCRGIVTFTSDLSELNFNPALGATVGVAVAGAGSEEEN